MLDVLAAAEAVFTRVRRTRRRRTGARNGEGRGIRLGRSILVDGTDRRDSQIDARPQQEEDRHYPRQLSGSNQMH